MIEHRIEEFEKDGVLMERTTIVEVFEDGTERIVGIGEGAKQTEQPQIEQPKPTLEEATALLEQATNLLAEILKEGDTE